MTGKELRSALMELGVMPPDYDLPLTYERTRGMRLTFLYLKGKASEPARYEEAARLCGEFIAAMEEVFSREPEKVHTHWLCEWL